MQEEKFFQLITIILNGMKSELLILLLLLSTGAYGQNNTVIQIKSTPSSGTGKFKIKYMKQILILLGLLVGITIQAQVYVIGQSSASARITLPLDSLIVGINGSKIDSIKVIDGEIYIYSNGQSFSGDTLSGLNSYVKGISNSVSGTGAFIGGGGYNIIEANANRGFSTNYSTAFGYSNQLTNVYGFSSGISNFIDANIGGAVGNNNITTANDSWSVGNRSSVGRIGFNITSSGIEDSLSDEGNHYYVMIDDAVYGEINSVFPYPGLPSDSVVPRFGTGATIDVYGNIRGPVDTAKRWAMHPYAVLRGADESSDTLIKILDIHKYNGDTKITLDSDVEPLGGDAHTRIYGSYAATLNVRRFGYGGNGLFSAGISNVTWNYGATSFGQFTRAIGRGAFTAGLYCEATGTGATSMGNYTEATKDYSSAFNYYTNATGIGSNAFNNTTTASGNYSNAFNYQTSATALYANSFGNSTQATSASSIASGVDSKSTLTGEWAHASNKLVNDGDAQISTYTKTWTKTGAGWHELIWFNIVDTVSIYNFDLKVIVKNITVGDEYGHCAIYNVVGSFSTWGGAAINYTAIGTPTVTLLGENFTTGDGTTTGPRVSWYGNNAGTDRVDLRFDGVADQKYDIIVAIKLVNLSTIAH